MELLEIIEGCKKGDDKSQRLFFKACYPRFFTMAYKHEKDANRADELAQDGLIRILDKIHQFDGDNGGAFYGWSRRIIYHLFIDRTRKKKARLETNFDFNGNSFNPYDNNGTAPCADSSLNNFINNISDGKFHDDPIEYEIKGGTIRLRNMLTAVDNLPLMLRVTFELIVLEGLTHKEAAEELEIAEGTTKAYLHRAKKKLRKELGDVAKLELTYN